MACASSHDKQMENFMGAEVFMSGIEQWYFQCVDDAADGVDDSSCQQPAECRSGQCVENLGKCQYTQPAHSDVDNRRKPFGTIDPKGFDQNADQCHSPNQNTQKLSSISLQRKKTNRRIASGNQYKYHHMVYFSQATVSFIADIERMVNRAGHIKKYHAQNKNR